MASFTPTEWDDNGFFVEMKFKIKNKIHVIHFGLDVTYHNLRPIFGLTFLTYFERFKQLWVCFLMVQGAKLNEKKVIETLNV